MPTEEQQGSSQADELPDDSRPPSPRHVFDDDVEMQSDPVPSHEQRAAQASDAHSASKHQTPHPSQGKARSPSDHKRSIPSRSDAPATNPEAQSHSQSQLLEQPSAADSHHEHTQQQAGETTEQASSTLFEKMLDKPARAPGLVSAWMTYVSNNGPDAMASLVSLVICAARPVPFAHQQLVTSEMIIANQPSESVAEICQVMAVDAPERVVVLAKDPASRRVRRAYDDLWRRIAAEAPDIVLYHTDCFDTLIPWLDAMSSSAIRALRVSACIAAYRLVDGFIEVNAQLRKNLASIQRQLNTEKRRSGISLRDQNSKASNTRGPSAKGKKKELSAKGKELSIKVDELTAKSGELTELSDRVYRTMFICRYRDISADVRSLSISALGSWIIMFPEQFLDDTHNKYIGWLLSDKDAGVRRTSLEVLLRMLKKKEYFENFETFLQRFSDRILEMAWDKDDLVSITAIRLLNFLLPHNHNHKLLRPSHCESICAIALGDGHTDIRRAAGEFLSTLVTMDLDDIAGSVSKPKQAYRKRGRPRSSSGPFNTLLREIPPIERSKDDIRELLYAMARKEDDTVDETLTVDAVWEHLPALRCWQAFDELLLERPASDSPSKDEETLTDTEKGILCRILLASAAEASGNGDPNRAKIVEKGEYADPETPSVLLSKQFLPQLPRLLSQYQSDPRTVCALVQLPRHFTMTTFEQQGQESYFSIMLERIIGVLLKHTGSEEVTSACAETLRYFLSDQNPVKKTTCTSLQLHCQRATKELALQVRADISKAEPDNVAALVSQVRVLAELIDSDLTTYETVKEILMFQENNLESSQLGDMVTVDAVRAACAFAVWSLSRIKSRMTAPGSSETPLQDVLDLDEVKEYRTHGADVVDVLQRICANKSMTLPTRIISARCILIILTLCRGIEKNTVMMIIRERKDPGGTLAAPDLDILRLKDSVPKLGDIMRSIVLAVVEAKLEQHKSKAANRSRVPSCLNENDQRDFFACLVQASLQSLLSRNISHLPLFGVLLKGEKEEKGPYANEYTTSRVCQDYLQQRQIRKTSLTNDIIKALGEVTMLNCTAGEHHDLIRELAESCVSFRYRRDLKAKASTELLYALMDNCSTSETKTEFFKKLELLFNVSYAVVGSVPQEDAQKALERLPLIDELLAKHKDIADEKLLKSYDLCRSSIQAVAHGTTPELPSFSRLTERPTSSRAITSRRKRRMKSPKWQKPLPGSTSVRKSSRVRKKVDYARMERSESEEGSSNDDVDSEEEKEEHVASEATVADVARNMMEYQNSPVARGKRGSKEIRSPDPSPNKRQRRTSGQSNVNHQESASLTEGNNHVNSSSSGHEKSAVDHHPPSKLPAQRDEQNVEGVARMTSNLSDSAKESEIGNAEASANEMKQSSAPQRRRKNRKSSDKNESGEKVVQSDSKQNGKHPRKLRKSPRSGKSLERAGEDDMQRNAENKISESETRRTRSSRKSSSQHSSKSDDTGQIKEGKENKDEVSEETRGKTATSKKGVVRRRRLRRW